jgi:peptidoglycan/xylan/chitin deacetylase (PgdA/CDA1 family)
MNCFARAVLSLTLLGLTAADSLAAECAQSPGAIGTSRVITVNPRKMERIGTLQFPETLPLNDHEVVLSFDDGPRSPYTKSVLDTLASQCVKAVFFPVGQMAKREPYLIRRAHSEGHTMGSHTQTHPHLAQLSVNEAEKNIDQGIDSVAAALADSAGVAPFFRAPFLETTPELDTYLRSRGLMLWGIDFGADDWERISPAEVVDRAVTAVEQKRKGVLLLHDVMPQTAAALPYLLDALKARSYKIVHVVADNRREPD